PLDEEEIKRLSLDIRSSGFDPSSDSHRTDSYRTGSGQVPFASLTYSATENVLFTHFRFGG
ncbi:MAG: hypothetical protein ACK5DJ_07285, partial [Bacteroidota bacterium]